MREIDFREQEKATLPPCGDLVVKITPVYPQGKGATIISRFFRQRVFHPNQRPRDSHGLIDEEAFNQTVGSYLEALSNKIVGACDFKIELQCLAHSSNTVVCSTSLNGFRRDFGLTGKSISMDTVTKALLETFDDMLDIHLREQQLNLELTSSFKH